MSTLRLILGDQLSPSISALRDHDPGRDVVLMTEVSDEANYVRHHKQKLVLIFSAMRHFAAELEARGFRVDYVRLEDEGNSGSFTGEVERALQRHGCDRVVVTEPGEWRVLEMLQGWEQRFGVPVEIRADDRFLCTLSEFRDWARGRKSLRMEFFYREMRRKTGWLMEDDKPLGGRWNYDAENRKALPQGMSLPPRERFEPDETTRDVMNLVQDRFSEHFGELDEFGWAVTRDDALEALDHFITACLPKFGDFQDAMKTGEDFLFHSLISPYLNIGLLLPTEVCEAALAALDRDEAPLAAVEGFLRQILGWREFVRGLYWLLMPGYAKSNFLEAKRSLPDFYWSGETDLNCLREAIGNTRRNAYAHHIQRLMVTGNFALLAGIEPAQVEEWYLLVYLDAFEWVELPNTHGMALFADGGVLASKPYAASGAYINRMSDHCRDCRFNPQEKLGGSACPFNYLYWNFLIENEGRLRSNPRMGLAYRNLDRLDEEQRDAMHEQALRFLDEVAPPH
jgi:deoxyribodipyrimidine photolyase-related protein